MIAAYRFMAQESQQILNIFFSCLDVLKRKDVILIEVQLMINLFQSLQNQERIFDLILYSCILFILFLLLICLILSPLFFYLLRSRTHTWHLLGSFRSTHTSSCFGCEQHNINNCYLIYLKSNHPRNYFYYWN
mgnify:CR=1 FL=1